ncbi:MAG: UDP-N-acetylmuramate--L-alanine ligase, partial [Hyphomicrobiaceae bacterium]
DHRTLAEGIRKHSGKGAIAIEIEQEVAPVLSQIVQPGDLVIGLGAGSITEWSHALPGQLATVHKASA